jgi:nucleotide-binding universal stress UspA family protein
MHFGDIVASIDHTESGQARLATALALAARSEAHLTCYYLMPRRGPAVEDFLDEPPAAEVENASQDFERQLSLHNVKGTWVLGNPARAAEELIAYSRCADLVVVGLGIPEEPVSKDNPIDVERLVLGTSRPVLGLPITHRSQPIGKRVMVAWDGSREASRAMHDALPFLRQAELVRVVGLDRDPLAIASPNEAVAHLRRAGIEASLDAQLDLNLPVGEEILSRLERDDIDLLVAGAFGHSRLIERVAGGATRLLLHQMMVPVLVSH